MGVIGARPARVEPHQFASSVRSASRHRGRDRLLIYSAQVTRNSERSVSATAAASGMAAISSAHLRLDVV